METERWPGAIDAHRDQLLLVTRLRCFVAHPLRRLRDGGPQHDNDPARKRLRLDPTSRARSAETMKVLRGQTVHGR